MKTLTKVLAAITAFVGIIGPAVVPYIDAFISAHPTVASIISAVSVILALFHQPQKQA